MKRFTPYLIGALVGMLILAAFTIGQVSAAPMAATGCFSDTNGHWAETFICWAAEKGIVGGFPDGTFGPNSNVTRAQVAVMLKNQAEIPPTSGDIIVNVGPGSWVVNGSSSNPYISFFTNTAYLRSAATGTYGYQTSVSVPSMLYGKYTRLKGARLCYTAHANASLNLVAVRLYSNTNGSGSMVSFVDDSTSRTDDACRTYMIESPISLLPTDYVVMYVQTNITNTSNYLRVTSASFIFEPTDSPSAFGPAPMRPEMPGLLEPLPGEESNAE